MTYECNGVAERARTDDLPGLHPRLAKSGHGAAFGIDTWHPNPGSPDAARWPKDFEKLVATWVQGHIVWPGVLSSAGSPSKGCPHRRSAIRPRAS